MGEDSRDDSGGPGLVPKIATVATVAAAVVLGPQAVAQADEGSGAESAGDAAATASARADRDAPAGEGSDAARRDARAGEQTDNPERANADGLAAERKDYDATAGEQAGTETRGAETRGAEQDGVESSGTQRSAAGTPATDRPTTDAPTAERTAEDAPTAERTAEDAAATERAGEGTAGAERTAGESPDRAEPSGTAAGGAGPDAAGSEQPAGARTLTDEQVRQAIEEQGRDPLDRYRDPAVNPTREDVDAAVLSGGQEVSAPKPDDTRPVGPVDETDRRTTQATGYVEIAPDTYAYARSTTDPETGDSSVTVGLTNKKPDAGPVVGKGVEPSGVQGR